MFTIGRMDVTSLLAEIDSEIARLQQARAALVTLGGAEKRVPGRPRKNEVAVAPKKRTMSPEARARIAAAQKKRWAAQKKSKG